MIKQEKKLINKIENKFHPIAEYRHNSLKYLEREYEEKWQLIKNNGKTDLIHDYGWDSSRFGMITWNIGFKGKLLDVGCGIGNFCRFVKAHSPFMEVHGLDKSPKAIEVSKKLADNIDFKVGLANKLPYKDETFDRIVTNDVIEHLRRPVAALKEMKRVLKPGGKIYITIPWRGLVKKEKEPGHIQEWTPVEFVKIMDNIFSSGSLTLPPGLTNRTTGETMIMYWFLVVGTK